MRYVGSSLEPVIEERPETVDLQLQYLRAGTIPVVMIPIDSSYWPAVPPRMHTVDIEANVRGAGRYIFNPVLVSRNQVLADVLAGNHGRLLGHLYSKPEPDSEAERRTVVVVARTATGITIQDSAVPNQPDAIARQSAKLLERFPDAVITVESALQVLENRMAA